MNFYSSTALSNYFLTGMICVLQSGLSFSMELDNKNATQTNKAITITKVLTAADEARIDKNGVTALHMLAFMNDPIAIRHLIASGENPNATITAPVIIHSWLSLAGETPLFTAVRQGYVDVIKTLIDWHAQVNHARCDGATALHIAVQFGDPGVVSLLMQLGAELRADNSGMTPLHYAGTNQNLVTILTAPRQRNLFAAEVAALFQ